MAREDLDGEYSFEDFSDAMRQLGWLSSYSRQALLSRHLLRSLQDSDAIEELLSRAPKRYALDCFRAIITALSGVTTERKVFSAPYEPSDRPETHYLAFNRRERLFEASSASGMPSLAFYYSSESSFGFENSTSLGDEDVLLIDETKQLSAGITLSTKVKADERISALRDEPLWATFRKSHKTGFDTFFSEWHPDQPHVGSFWRRWIDGFLAGEPIDWDIQSRIARLDDVIWEAGPEAIAEAIAEIEAKQAAWNLGEYLSETPIGSSAELSPLMGHNNPPPELDALPVSQSELQRLVQIVQIVQQQLQAPSPSLEILENLTQEAEEIQEKSAGWLANGLGLSRDEFFKEIGKWGGRAAIAGLGAGAVWLAGAVETLYPMIQALWNLLRMLAT